MGRYPFSSFRRRRRRSRKWVYVISVLLIVITVKAFIRSSEPASTFGDEDEFGASIAGDQTKNGAVLFAMKPIPEPTLHKIPDSISEPAPESTAFINEVMTYINTKPPGIVDARGKLNEMLSMPMTAQQLAFVKKQLSKLSEEWLFSRAIFPQDKLCSHYKVEPGDQFRIIGRKFKVPYKILMQINNISNPRALRAGETIKVINGPFHCRIYRSTFTMDLYLQDTFVRSFSIGLGKPGMETPTGRWVVKSGGKLISPPWTDPITGKAYEAEDPDYPLGSRWIGLEGIEGNAKDRTGFAIHGAKNPEEISIAGSQGCIRLHNDDAILVYDLLMPGLSQVIVVE
jgi:LysM repeat protein